MQKRRGERNRALLAKLKQRKMLIEEEELLAFARKLEKKKTVGRPHIAALMVQKGYVGSMQEAFDRYLKEGGLCYVSGFKYTPQDAIDQIRQAGGKAVLAHPHFIKKGALLKKLLSHPFDGIECYYANLPKALEAPWLKIAKEKGWIATGGSDYHGTFKPHISLGCSWVGEETFRKLQSRC
jgi:predicted metal-dependent phosphoesterase TrpH